MKKQSSWPLIILLALVFVSIFLLSAELFISSTLILFGYLLGSIYG